MPNALARALAYEFMQLQGSSNLLVQANSFSFLWQIG